MKDTINQKVKHRESFRPFAPSILKEHAQKYFDFDPGNGDLSFMTFVVPAKGPAKDRAPAVVHADDTARIQTVDPERFPRYHRLISRFHEETGIPTVLNTSFNDSGDPIVETPRDAVNTFLKTGIDRLFLGDFVVNKQ